MNINSISQGQYAQGAQSKNPQGAQDFALFSGLLDGAQTSLSLDPQALMAQAEAKAHELQENKQNQESKEFGQELHQDAALAMIQQERLQEIKLQNAVKGSSRFLDGMNSQKSQAQSEAIQEGVMQRRGHLYNPALARELQGQTQAGPESAKPQGPEAKQADFASLSTEAKEAEATKTQASKPQATPATDAQAQSRQAGLNLAREAGAPQFKANQELNQKLNNLQATGANALKGQKTAPKFEMGKSMEQNAGNLKGSEAKAEVKSSAQANRADQASRFQELMDTKDIAQKVKMSLNADKTEMIMKVTPEHLGKMEIKLQKQGDEMTAQFKVESLAAKELLQAQAEELLGHLRDEGIEVSKIEIQTQDQSQGQASGHAMNGEGRSGSDFAQKGTDPALTLHKTESMDQNEAQAASPVKKTEEDRLLNLIA